ncbi:metal-sulfur cluster assembly factor, partial [Brucella gallinifaecis]|uniref:metal-sulfur cluster assembly factor n=1 Tax=Brucella gallinifaecis TaxID=215590 RepID=UPI00235E6BB0
MQSEERERLEDEVRNALRIVMDPELGINLVDLGMIYMITAHANGDVSVKMTTTTRGCPAAGFLTQAVQGRCCTEPIIDRFRSLMLP